MALSKEYTNEQVNCFKVCYVTSESGEIYYSCTSVHERKEKWDKLYKTTTEQFTPLLYLYYQGLC